MLFVPKLLLLLDETMIICQPNVHKVQFVPFAAIARVTFIAVTQTYLREAFTDQTVCF